MARAPSDAGAAGAGAANCHSAAAAADCCPCPVTSRHRDVINMTSLPVCAGRDWCSSIHGVLFANAKHAYVMRGASFSMGA